MSCSCNTRILKTVCSDIYKNKQISYTQPIRVTTDQGLHLFHQRITTNFQNVFRTSNKIETATSSNRTTEPAKIIILTPKKGKKKQTTRNSALTTDQTTANKKNQADLVQLLTQHFIFINTIELA